MIPGGQGVINASALRSRATSLALRHQMLGSDVMIWPIQEEGTKQQAIAIGWASWIIAVGPQTLEIDTALVGNGFTYWSSRA